MKAIWNGKIIAESDDIVNVEGNAYFPEESVNKEYFQESDTHSVCHWKGTASYCTLDVTGRQNKDAAWYYPDPSELAQSVRNRIAFWRGVQIIND